MTTSCRHWPFSSLMCALRADSTIPLFSSLQTSSLSSCIITYEYRKDPCRYTNMHIPNDGFKKKMLLIDKTGSNGESASPESTPLLQNAIQDYNIQHNFGSFLNPILNLSYPILFYFLFCPLSLGSAMIS